MTSLPDSLIDALAHVHSVGVITGAGVSAASGIQTYRGKGGVYDDPEEGRMTVGFVVSYTSPDPLLIGSKFSGAVFDGLIDEVALWNRGLSAEEVKTIFDAGSAGMCQPIPPPTPEELLE